MRHLKVSISEYSGETGWGKDKDRSHRHGPVPALAPVGAIAVKGWGAAPLGRSDQRGRGDNQVWVAGTH